MQAVCGPVCALKLVKSKGKSAQERDAKRAEKAARRARTAAKEKLKTRSQWIKEAQVAFNSYIRARDYGKPCISCNRYISDNKFGGAVDCGHYRSRGAAGHLRFHMFNAHAQCKQCNRSLSGNVVDYRICLIRRIGLERVERIEHDNNPRTFEIEYLKRLKRIFNRRARHYKKLRGI